VEANAWFCWGATDGGVVSTGGWQNVVSIGTVTNGVAFSNLVTGFSTNTTYFYRCYAENPYGSDWSDTATTFSGTPVGVGGAPWTPTNITMAAWYDAADAGTMWDDTVGTIPATTSVARWDDKSGNNRHVTQSTSDKRPATASTIGSLNAIQYDGTDDELQNMTFGISSLNLSIFAVQRYVTRVMSDASFAINRTTATEGSITHYDADTANHSMTYRYPTPTTYMVYASPTADQLMSYVKNGTSDQEVWENGTSKRTKTDAMTTFTSQLLALGSRNGANYGNVRHGEIIILGSAANDSDRQKIEGYLAHKWGLAANLPSDHPYKNTPPGGSGAVIGNRALTGISASAATFNAALNASGTNYDITVHYGTTDGGTKAGAWGASEYAGSWTNVSTNVSTAVSGLTAGQTYYYTFMASNTAGVVWASPSWTFRTSVAPSVTTNYSVPHTWLEANVPGSTNDYEAAALDDPDNDGFDTWEEYWSGTDPQNSNSYLRIDSVTFDGTNIVIVWSNAVVGAGLPPLGIQARGDLLSGSWSNVGQKSLANGVNAWSNSAAQQLYYRLAVTNAP
jgi:hypothetical protein